LPAAQWRTRAAACSSQQRDALFFGLLFLQDSFFFLSITMHRIAPSSTVTMAGVSPQQRVAVTAFEFDPREESPIVHARSKTCVHRLLHVCGPWSSKFLRALVKRHSPWRLDKGLEVHVVRQKTLAAVVHYMLCLADAWKADAPLEAANHLRECPEPPPLDVLELYLRYWACRCIVGLRLRA